MDTTSSLADFMDIIKRTKCDGQKTIILRTASMTMKNIDRELLRSSMQTTILSPLFTEVVQLAIPVEFTGEHLSFDKEDFTTLVERTEVVLKFLYVIFDQCCQCPVPVDTKPLDECLPLLIVVISSNIRNSLWSRDSIQKLNLQVLNQLRILYKADSLSELLLLNLKSSRPRREATMPASCLMRRYLTEVKTRLSRHNWQANPTFLESFYWMLMQMIKFPNLSSHLDIVLPPALNLVDSHVTEHKVMGIHCLQHIASNVSNDELRWYGRAEVVYTALKQQVYSREPDIIRAILPALLTVLPIIDKDPAKPAALTSQKQIDTVLSIIINNAATENGIVLRRLYTHCIADFVSALGVCVVRHLKQLVSLVSNYLEVFDGPEEKARFNAIGILRALMFSAWPRIPFHADTILKAILQLIQDIDSDRTTTPKSVKDKLKEEAVSCISILKEICPEVQLCLQALCDTEELSDVCQIVQVKCSE